MTHQPFRTFEFGRDIKAVQRAWIECGWVDDDKDGNEAVATLFKTGEAEIATIDDVAECACHWTPGTILYRHEPLQLGAVTAVTTSHIGRKRGFAKTLTARSLVRQREAGMHVSALGIFDQGFYNQVGYGNGPYEVFFQIDPGDLKVDRPYRTPRRLTKADFRLMHDAMHNRQMHQGGVCLSPSANTQAELMLTEKPFGLGYFDGPGGTLSHFIWGEMQGENGPYRITMRAYQNPEQLLELLALLKSLADQVNSVKILEFGELQLQDLLDQPFRSARKTKGSVHAHYSDVFAYWQLRILDLETCLAKTQLHGPTVAFNLHLTDPLNEILAGQTSWQGLTGDYVITLGPESSATAGTRDGLPSMSASINAFTRLWFGIQPATSLAISDDLSADLPLLESLDRTVGLPKPHCGWDF